MSSPKPPSPSSAVCGVESDGAAYETAEAIEASTDLVLSSLCSAWRETRRVKIGQWIALAPGEIHNSGEVHRGFYGSRVWLPSEWFQLAERDRDDPLLKAMSKFPARAAAAAIWGRSKRRYKV
ncbi:unnamed protein product [Brassica oleracea]